MHKIKKDTYIFASIYYVEFQMVSLAKTPKAKALPNGAISTSNETVTFFRGISDQLTPFETILHTALVKIDDLKIIKI